MSSSSVAIRSLANAKEASTPWPKRTSSLPLRVTTPDGSKSTLVLNNNKLITVAISGCSSSGKSTLAFLLSKIFSPSSSPVIQPNPQIKLNDSTTNLCLTFSDKESINSNAGVNDGNMESIADDGRAILINEDVFFLPKSLCPLITFTNTPADVRFIEESLADGSIGSYILSWEGSRITKRHDLQQSYSDSAICGAVVNEMHATGYQAIPSLWRITGPDTDCWAAVNVPELLSAIKDIRQSGALPTSRRYRYEKEACTLSGPPMSSAEQEAVLRSNLRLIIEMKEVVKNWGEDQAVHAETGFLGLKIKGANEAYDEKKMRPKLAIIEGFLLFANPTSTDHKSEDPNDNNKVSYCENELGDEEGTLEERAAFRQFEASEATYQVVNAQAKAELLSHFDIKLFLPTSMQEAKARRFSRSLYIDAPNGERLPGQMWKTDGYFNDIAWGNYVKEHQWLIKGSNLDGPVESSAEAVKAGIHLRPNLDADIEASVRWAVGVILSELGKKAHTPVSIDVRVQNKEGFADDEFCDNDGLVGGTAKVEQNQEKKKPKKKSVVQEKLSRIKTSILDYVRPVRIKKANPDSKDRNQQTNRNSIVSFLSKNQSTGEDARETNDKDKEMLRDVGMKTVLGSGKLDRGFFSPKPQHDPLRKFWKR